jgi:hypothetical protein
LDSEWANLCSKVDDKSTEYSIGTNGELRFKGRLWVPNDLRLKEYVLAGAHKSQYAIHPGSTKMYKELKQNFWWPNMKKEIAEYVSKCLTYQRIKIEHQRPGGMLQQLEIPQWKWEHVTMDFVTSLPRTNILKDTI